MTGLGKGEAQKSEIRSQRSEVRDQKSGSLTVLLKGHEPVLLIKTDPETSEDAGSAKQVKTNAKSI
jgi:hypothetical protein